MMKINDSNRSQWVWGVVVGLMTMATPLAAVGETIIVQDGESIQAAVDLAQPGDTIIVRPGTYTGTDGDAVVTVTTDNITIKGSRAAVIDATGFDFGIMVGGPPINGPDPCPEPTVSGFTSKGLTFTNAQLTGLLLVGVDGYRITHGTYLNNVEYGPFPMCSKNGVIAHNTAVGHNGAGIPVANDVGTVIEHNLAMQNLIGINVENSSQTVVRHNVTSDNTAGIVVVVLPGLPMPFTKDVQIEHNVAAMNNRPNPVPVGGEPLGAIPTGTGILVVGADRVSIDNNTVTNNDSIGVGIVSNIFCFGDNRIEPFVDDIEVRNNVILGNGGSPDPERAIIPGVDIGFIPNVIDPTCNIAADPGPTDNCFSDNVFDTDFPPGIVALFQC